MPFRFKGLEKRPSLFIARCGKSQLIVECDTLAELRKAARERVNDEDDDILAWLLVLRGLQEPNPMQWFKAIEGKRISLDLVAAIKIEEAVGNG